MPEDKTFEEFKSILDQLKPEARQDVLDYAVFITWKQTGAPAPIRSVMRGGWLWMIEKIKSLVKP